MAPRRFEMDSASGGKFWEIEAEGKRTTVRYGALSASRARVHKKEHASKAEALDFVADQIRSKERKGYAEVKPAPNVSPQKSSPEKKRRSSPAVEPATAKRKKTPAPSGAVISDCTFLLTGTLSVKRSEVEAEICRHGGHIGTISKATHLLCGEDGYGTKKHQEAEKRGLPVVTEEWVRSLFSGGGSGAGCSGSRAGRGSGGGASGKCSCGNVLTADSKFCSRCGKEAPEQPATCSCGNLLTADANYCSRCGKKVAATEGPPAADDLFKPVRVALGGADNKELMGSATYTLEEVGLKDGSKLEVFARACWKKYLENAFSKHRNRGKAGDAYGSLGYVQRCTDSFELAAGTFPQSNTPRPHPKKVLQPFEEQLDGCEEEAVDALRKAFAKTRPDAALSASVGDDEQIGGFVAVGRLGSGFAFGVVFVSD